MRDDKEPGGGDEIVSCFAFSERQIGDSKCIAGKWRKKNIR